MSAISHFVLLGSKPERSENLSKAYQLLQNVIMHC